MTAHTDSSTTQTHKLGLRFIASVKPLLFFAGLWWLLTKGEVSSWVIGIIVVPFSAWLSITLFKDTRLGQHYSAHSVNNTQHIRMLRLFHFVPFFLLQSILGGWQTAMLALRPSMPIHPGFFRYNLRLKGPSARLFFIHLVSLLPGTVSAKLEDGQLLIHALEISPQNSHDINRCEQQVAKLFSGELMDESSESSAHTNHVGDLQ
ncbi:MAG: multicomponent Na+:H+ antiporter subunit E [Candidatus Endobugula sp.]|jgi:multicomponent Na+:H+ antiporter subunit E